MKKRPPSGATPNLTFSVTFDKPGTYPFLCLVHPDRMRGTVEVVSASATDVPDQAQIDAQAQAESAPLLALVQKAKDQGSTARSDPGPRGTTLWFVRAGNSDWFSGDSRSQVFDFLPKAMTIKAGDTVVWASTYFHTITFNQSRATSAGGYSGEAPAPGTTPDAPESEGGDSGQAGPGVRPRSVLQLRRPGSL